MVYDKNGNVLNSVYSKNGEPLSTAYDKDGNVIFSSADLYNIMTFNVQRWAGRNSDNALLNTIFDNYNPVIVGLQECGYQGSATKGGYVPVPFPYGALGTMATNVTGILSKIPFTDFECHKYATNSDENREYTKCYIDLGGKKTAWFNTHIQNYSSWYDEKYTAGQAQAKELFDAVQEEQTFILTGDFNCFAMNKEHPQYNDFWKQFEDAGYNMANWTDERGFNKTWFNDTTGESGNATDNIITSSDIEIVNVIYDRTKIDYQSASVIDHIPVIATVRFLES